MTYRKVEGDEYQRGADRVCRVMSAMLDRVGAAEATAQHVTEGHGFDGGPVIQGTLGALLRFAVRGDLSPDEIRAELLRGIDEMLPQFIAARDAERLSTTTATGSA